MAEHQQKQQPQLRSLAPRTRGHEPVVCDERAIDHPCASHRSLKVTWLDIPQVSIAPFPESGAARHSLGEHRAVPGN